MIVLVCGACPSCVRRLLIRLIWRSKELHVNILGTLSVFPHIPERIHRLHELAYNLWWSWNPDAQDLYAVLDLPLWDNLAHNPVKFLREVSQENLNRAASDASYTACLLYTSDAADERSSVDLGGRRIIKKKKKKEHRRAALHKAEHRNTPLQCAMS